MIESYLGLIISILRTTGVEFIHLLVAVLPYFALGAAAGAALQTWLSPAWLERAFAGSGLRPLLLAVGAAALLPGCSCATIPMASGLGGAARPRVGTVTAFIFTSPLLSPITVVLTWAMLGWQMTVARVVASLVGGLLLGVLVNRIGAPVVSLPVRSNVASACAPGTCAPDGDNCIDDAPRFFSVFWTILRSITPYFLLGMLIAGALSALLPEDAIPKYLGGSAGVGAYFLAAVVGIPLYVCEGEEVPLTYALVTHGLAPGPALTFLLGSVGTCIPTILMAPAIIGRRATAVYSFFWFVFAIAAGVLFQALLPS